MDPIPKKPESVLQNCKYVDLAATDEADENGTYSEALFCAVNNPNVFNIALTGPYGSGKSSVIKTFLKKYRKTWHRPAWTFRKRKALEISLASFISEVPVNDSKKTEDNTATKNQDSTETNTAKTDDQTLALSKQEIERSILQQLLYGADANRLPLSRFRRKQSQLGRTFIHFLSCLLVCHFGIYHYTNQR